MKTFPNSFQMKTVPYLKKPDIKPLPHLIILPINGSQFAGISKKLDNYLSKHIFLLTCAKIIIEYHCPKYT